MSFKGLGGPITAQLVTTINGLIRNGANVTITGSGTAASPYVISSTGGGGGGSIPQSIINTFG
jgi:hypothetical protein